MTNIQLLLSIAIPTLAVIIASLRNEQAINSLRNDFNALRSDLRRGIRILTDQSSTHGREIEALRKQG